MNAENVGTDALDRDKQTPAGRQGRRGWWRRNGRRLLAIVLLLIVALGGAAYWWLIGRVRQLDVYRTAMQAIEADQGLQQSLGRPIEAVNFPLPSPRIEEREIDIQWSIRGPKGQAEAHVHAKMMGKWETDVLEVKVNGKRISLHVSGGTEADAPPYAGATKSEDKKPDGKKPEADAPSPDIHVSVPGADEPPSSGEK